MRGSGIVTLVVLLLAAAAPAGDEESVGYDWRSETRAGGESTMGCAIGLTATRSGSYVSVELAVRKTRGDIKETELRIRSARRKEGDLLGETPVAVHSGWIRTPSGTSEGLLRKAEGGGETGYVGIAPGLETFATIFRGMREGGAEVGIRLEPGGPEEVLRAGPPPAGVQNRVIACVNGLVSARP